jgi:hypothetical protein
MLSARRIRASHRRRPRPTWKFALGNAPADDPDKALASMGIYAFETFRLCAREPTQGGRRESPRSEPHEQLARHSRRTAGIAKFRPGIHIQAF